MGAVVLFSSMAVGLRVWRDREMNRNEEKAESLVVSFETLPIILNAGL